MHLLLFSAKRVHHRAVAVWAPKLARVQLTPARCELLYAVSRQQFGDIWQGDLVTLLGCAASTASRMLTALERLGMIARYWVHDNRKIVVLTEKGLAALEAALAMLRGADALYGVVSSALQCVGDTERGAVFSFLRLLRRRLGQRPVLDPYDARCGQKLGRVSRLPPFDGH